MGVIGYPWLYEVKLHGSLFSLIKIYKLRHVTLHFQPLFTITPEYNFRIIAVLFYERHSNILFQLMYNEDVGDVMPFTCKFILYALIRIFF